MKCARPGVLSGRSTQFSRNQERHRGSRSATPNPPETASILCWAAYCR